MKIADARDIHAAIVYKGTQAAASKVLELMGKPYEAVGKAKADSILRGLFQHLLDTEEYLTAATLQWGPDMFNTEPESTVRVFEALKKGSLVLLMGASSMSKCLGPDVPVMMFDGSIKSAKHIKVGDILMGDDSGPRNVLQANSGIGPLYRIKPERGDEWVCNDAHILSLRVSSDKKCGSGHVSKKWRKGDVVDIPIGEYLKLSPDKKGRLKQFSVEVSMPPSSQEIDPYIYGSWLGDGGTDVPALHSPDGPMARYWCEYFTGLGYRIWSGYHDKCPMWAVRNLVRSSTNPFLDFIRTSVMDGEKFILPNYTIGSIPQRLRLLAGLIDSDGWVHQGGYRFVSKFKRLAEQTAQIARSVGYAARVHLRKYGIKSRGFIGNYWVVTISGKGVIDIPTLEKKTNGPTGRKNATNTSFKVEPIGDGEYFGFTIDGNRRFLLGDCTVTHNTYAAGGFFLLDYLRDPLYTTVKLAAVNEDHLRKNLFAHVATLYRACAIPCAHEIQIRDSDLWMGIKEAGYEFGISGIAFKQSQETSGQFKGYKAKPVRKIPHKQFGVMSRLRVLGDEGQNWPNGPFKDFNSLIASKSGAELVKLAVAFNPESTSQSVVQMAEPEQGWDADDLDRLYDYESRAGWLVCRLDAALSENVKQKKLVYVGLQTYEGFMSYLKAGGDSSSNYFTFARGFPPMKGEINTIIPPSWPQDARGEATFVETPVTLASVDLAFMGKDSAQMAVARWGLASGWRNQLGEIEYFKDRTNVTRLKPRHVLQIDQLLPLQKHDDTIKMAEEIMGRCKKLKISPEWLAIDKTSIGLGTYSHLNTMWGECFGISWNEGATENKILAEDKEGADKQCEGVMSEMWWAFRRWLDPRCRAVLINPIIPPQPIHTQLTSRRYRTGKRGIKVEPKEEYKSRNQASPDEADTFVMLVHLVRRSGKVVPGLIEEQTPQRADGVGEIKFGSVAQMSPSCETDDSIQSEGSKELDHIEI